MNLLNHRNDDSILLFKDNKDNFASTKEFHFFYMSKPIHCKKNDDLKFFVSEGLPSNTDLLQGFFPPNYPNDRLYDYLPDEEKKINQLAYY